VSHVPGLGVPVVVEGGHVTGKLGIQGRVTVLSLNRRLVGTLPLARPLTLKQT
jgi:hypothetical protein